MNWIIYSIVGVILTLLLPFVPLINLVAPIFAAGVVLYWYCKKEDTSWTKSYRPLLKIPVLMAFILYIPVFAIVGTVGSLPIPFSFTFAWVENALGSFVGSSDALFVLVVLLLLPLYTSAGGYIGYRLAH